jgi:urease accessory protein
MIAVERGVKVFASMPADDAIFAGNRAVGRIALSVKATADASRRRRVQESGALRVRFPNAASRDTLDAVMVNTAGGMTGGDRFDIDIAVGAGASLSVTTAAAEKIYRSLGPDTVIDVKLGVGPGGALAWLPQETILFDRLRLHRTIEVDLADDANLFLAEAIVFGRSAMGETVTRGRVFDRWRVRRGGALVFAESLRLDGAIEQKLAQRAVAGGGVAVASVLKIPGGEAEVAALRAAADVFAGEVGASAWNGMVLARLVASDGAALRRDLVGVLTALGDAPLPRLWLN